MALRHSFGVILLTASACHGSLPEGVIVLPDARPASGFAYAMPGPMPRTGPFKTHMDALLDACPRLLSLPNAVGGRQEGPFTTLGSQDRFQFKRYVDVSTEYCAWIYYTPHGVYEMSWVGTNTEQPDSKLRNCNLPHYVSDPRYPDSEIMYVFAIHTHPVPGELTRGDIEYIIRVGEKHGKTFYTPAGPVNLGIIAFTSNSTGGKVTCDGFFQYTPFTGELQRWTRNQDGQWRPEKMGKIAYEWKADGSLDIHWPERKDL
jgi:hypothetical protein